MAVDGIDEAGVEDEACYFAAGVDVDIAVVAAADEEVHQLAQWKVGIVVTSEMSIPVHLADGSCPMILFSISPVPHPTSKMFLHPRSLIRSITGP